MTCVIVVKSITGQTDNYKTGRAFDSPYFKED